MKTIVNRDEVTSLVSEIIKKYPKVWPVLCLPYFFSFGGLPFTIDEHFYTEVLYKINDIPQTLTMMTARQVGKSVGIAGSNHLRCWTQPYFSSLIFAPLCSQVSYLSDTYFAPLVNDSPIRSLVVSKHNKQNSLFKEFRMGSKEIFTYAYDSPDRIRGKSVDAVSGDEMQDFNYDFLPVIEECMSARKHVGMRQYFGTPKTLDNTLTKLFEEGSQAEWVVKCPGCNKDNIPNIENHVIKMIGKTGVICAFCGKLLNPAADGRWVHMRPEKRMLHSSYHVPQIICPTHYAIREKWDRLLLKMEKQPKALFYNEVLGQPCDAGQKLVSIAELKNACQLPIGNDIDEIRDFISRRYIMTVLGVDWSGGGMDYQSYTGIALAGLRADGVVEIPYMTVLPYSTDHVKEAQDVLELANRLGAATVAHDFSGAGNVRETLLVHSGWPYERLVPITLTRTNGMKGIMYYNDPKDTNVRHSWTLDKGRSLVLTCTLIKSCGVLFGQYEPNKEQVEHFLALMEHYVERPVGGPVFAVHRVPGKPDDVAHAVNFAVMTLFQMNDNWPNIANQFTGKYNLPLTEDQI